MMRKLVFMLLIGAICLLGLTSVSVAQESLKENWGTLQEYEEATGKKIEKFNESPALKVKVAAGQLPPVEERLPKEPLVVEVIEEIGEYGGTAFGGTSYLSYFGEGVELMGREGMLRIGRDCKTIVPNIAKNWKFSPDGKTLTLYLRKGIKWSDGAPFTADDILFWWEDVVLNDDLTPVKPEVWSPGGKLMTMEKVDDYTIQLHFATSFPYATATLAHYGGLIGNFALPNHYLKKFHPRYTPIEDLEKFAKEKGFDYWHQLFLDRNRWGHSVSMQTDLPTLGAFMLVKEIGNNSILERNPYYWKVDTAGNQLPYIDKVIVIKVADKEMMDAKLITGDFDLGCLETRAENYSLYKENAEKGGYRVLPWQSCHGSAVIYQVNQTSEDPILRKIFRDVRFRRALSLAINREEINDVVFYGLAELRQFTVIPQSVYYEEEFARAYAEYDSEEANRLLDEMGLKWDKNHEYRLRSDGKILSSVLEYYLSETPKDKVSELVKEYWKAIGFKITIKQISGELQTERAIGNKIQVGLWHGDAASDWLFPINSWMLVSYTNCWGQNWNQPWSTWYVTNGERGEEPPDEVRRNLRRREKMMITVDKEERIRLGKEILRSQAENLWVIGTVGLWPAPVVVQENLRNVPEKGMHGWDVMWTYPYNPEQFFFKHPLLPRQK